MKKKRGSELSQIAKINFLLFFLLLISLNAQAATLTVNASGTGSGTVQSDVGGISFTYPDVSSAATSVLPENSSLVISATADTGSKVALPGCALAGGVPSGNNTSAAICTFTNSLTFNKSIQAVFTLDTYTLTVNANDTGVGAVTTDTGTIDYTYPATSTASTVVAYGSSIVVTATADTGTKVSLYGCAYAGGVLSGDHSSAVCTISNIISNKTLEAAFTLSSYTVIVNASGTEGTGTVKSDVGSIDFAYPDMQTATSTPLGHGNSIVVTATADPGSVVALKGCVSLGGTASGDEIKYTKAICTFSALDGNKTIEAMFAKQLTPWTLFLPTIINNKDKQQP
jgi:hypothetical protein